MNRKERFNRWITAMVITLIPLGLMAQTADTTDDTAMYGAGAAFARLYAVDGSAKLERDSREPVEAVANLTIEPLDILSTGPNGRAVILFMDGSMLKLNGNTRIEFLEIGNLDQSVQLAVLARLWQGNVMVDVSDDPHFENRSFRMDTEDATIYLLSNGKYRLDKPASGTALKVFSGSAELSNGQASRLLHAGEEATAERGYDSIRTAYFNTFDMDTFDIWAMNSHRRTESAGNQYVPPEIRHYTVELDNYGTWYYDTGLATYVWRPSIVVSDWSPYSNGYWQWSPYGMTWVSYYPWGWAPFHYGAWDWSVSFGWVWVPGRVYSPGWVTWCYWDNYVGWYPYNRYYWRHHYRGRVVARRPRHRVVYTSVDRLRSRRARYVTRDLPHNRQVVRVDRPILPDHRKLARNPSVAIREAVKRPITRTTIRERSARVRETLVTRSGSAVSGRHTAGKIRGTSHRGGVITRGTTIRERTPRTPDRHTVTVPKRTPVIRRGNTGTTRSGNATRSKVTIRRPIVRNQSERSGGSGSGTIIRRAEPSHTVRPSAGHTPTVTHRTPSVTSRGSSWRRSTSTPRPSVKPRNTTVRPRTFTVKPRIPTVRPHTSSRSTTTVRPRRSSAPHRVTTHATKSTRSTHSRRH